MAKNYVGKHRSTRSFVHKGLCGGKLRVEVSTTELQNGGFGLGLQIIQITQFRESLSSGLVRTGLRIVFQSGELSTFRKKFKTRFRADFT